MSLEDLDDSDIQNLRKLLESSGRAAPERRKALCIEIGIDPAELNAIWTLTTHDFVIELIDLLQKRKLETTIYKLYLQLQSAFKGSKYVPILNAIVCKIKDKNDGTSDNVKVPKSILRESSSQLIIETFENTNLSSSDEQKIDLPDQVNSESSNQLIPETSKQVNLEPSQQADPEIIKHLEPESINQSIKKIPENLSESKSANEQIKEIPPNGKNPPKIPKWRKIFLRFLQNGLSLRKAFVLSLVVTSGIVGLRFFAVFEWLELKTFDHFMQARLKEEKEDNRLLIIAITDDDIKAQDKRGEKGFGSSLRDPSLDKLLGILEQHQPRVIGIDLYRAFPVDNKTPDLVKRLQQKNIVTVCKAPVTNEEGNPIASSEIPPPPEIKMSKNLGERVGFSDFITDVDDHVRRHLMAQDIIPGTECRTKESFSLLLARSYLQQELEGNKQYKLTITPGENPRLGKVVFNTVQFFTGGYQGVDSSGFQVLLNYRATISGNVAKVLTLEDMLNNKFNHEDIKGKIILIGSFADQEGPRDEWSTPYGTMNGVMVHAQMVSQILSTVLDGRSLLRVWSQGIEIIWIGSWSFFGGFLVCYWRRLKTIGLATTASILVLYITCLSALTIASLWIPFIPAVLAFTTSGTIFIYLNHFNRKYI